MKRTKKGDKKAKDNKEKEVQKPQINPEVVKKFNECLKHFLKKMLL